MLTVERVPLQSALTLSECGRYFFVLAALSQHIIPPVAFAAHTAGNTTLPQQADILMAGKLDSLKMSGASKSLTPSPVVAFAQRYYAQQTLLAHWTTALG